MVFAVWVYACVFQNLSCTWIVALESKLFSGDALHVFSGDDLLVSPPPHEGLGGLSRDCVLRIPSVVVKGD